MQLSLLTYNAHNINDGTNYKAYMPGDTVYPRIEAEWVERAYADAVFAGKSFKGVTKTIVIKCCGTVHSQVSELAGWFDRADCTLRTLVAQDTADSNKQWQMSVTPLAFNSRGGVCVVILAVSPAYWQTVTQVNTAWPITGTSDTQAVTVGGNVAAKPIIELTPTSAKTGGYGYNRYVSIYNPVSYAYPTGVDCMDITGTTDGFDTAALISVAARTCQVADTSGMTSDAVTIAYDTATSDGLTASGMAYVDTEQFGYTGNTGSALTGIARGINGTTAAAHADNAVIYQSYVQADGDDIRVMVDGVEVDRWFGTSDGGAFGTTNTAVWCNIPYSAKQEMTLGTAIASTDTITEIQLAAPSAANRIALSKLPLAGVVQIGSERLAYTGVNIPAYKLTGVTQAQKKSSVASHATTDTVIWIEHDVYIMYGSSDATAPVVDDTKKPIIDLGLSTSDSWTYTSFSDTAGLRSGRWKPSIPVNTGGKSVYYTGSHGAESDPATEMGMGVLAYQVGSRWYGGSASVIWQLYHPGGFTEVTSSGAKYISSASSGWPAICALQKSLNGINWTTVLNQATPATSDAGSWMAWTDTSDTLAGTYQYLRFITYGSNAANVANNACYNEVQGATVLLTNTPVISMGAENSNYQLAAKITNNISGEWLSIDINIPLNTKVTIDCEQRKAYMADGTVIPVKLSTNRNSWLDMAPGTCTLQFDDVGSNALTGAVLHYDRSNVTG